MKQLNIDKAKKSLKTITYLLTFLLIINLAQATDWGQYTPSPTSSSLKQVWALQDGRAVAMVETATDWNETGTKWIIYNGTAWNNATSPSGGVKVYDTFSGCDKTNNSKIRCMWVDSSTGTSVAINEYNPATNSWSLLDSHTFTGTQGSFYINGDIYRTYTNFVCTYDENGKCYTASWNSTSNGNYLWYFDGSSFSLESSDSFYNPVIPIYSNKEIMGGWLAFGWAGFMGYNGTNWYKVGIDYCLFANPQYLSKALFKVVDYTSTKKILTGTKYDSGSCGKHARYVTSYNVSSGMFDKDTINLPFTTPYPPYSINQASMSADILGGHIWAVNYENSSLNEYFFGSTSLQNQVNTTQPMRWISYDMTSKKGWAVGEGGTIYQYQGIITNETYNATYTFSVIPRIDPQETIYGNQVIFYGKATYELPVNSNLTLEIWDVNFTTLYKTATLNNVPNGAEVELYRITQNSILWTGYQAGNYTYNLQATLVNNNASLSNSTLWTVINGETINQTNYEIQEYFKLPDDTGFTGIYSITNYDEDNAYTSIQNGSNIYIASWDISNPSNIIYDRLNTAINQQSGRNGNPNSISSIDMKQGTDNLFIGTNDDLFIYNNASNRKASGLIYDFDKGFGILENDGINDVSAMSLDYAYVCQDGTGLENDDIYQYNHTLADFQDQMNSAPCISIKYDGWVYVHGGGSTNIKIWNPITQTLTSTIDFTKTISTRAYRDLLDVKNDYLSFIAGKDEIRRYDISNASNPILSGKCFTNETNEEIESIEAITNDEIIIGLYNPRNNVDIIYVCDFGNNDTYSATKGGYVAQYLSGIYGTKAWEITKSNNQGKILMASGDRIEIFFYEKTNTSIQVNNPPVIDDYTFTPNTTICLNQIVDIEIIAHDPDTTPPADYLQYGVSCSGGGQPTTYSAYNLLTCSYSTAGTKTITIIVKDNHGLPSTASYDTITVNNCNQTNVTTIFFKIIDGNTANPIIGATINIYINQTLIATGTTNNNGYSDFNGLTPLTYYRATFTKDGYATKTEYFYTNNIRYVRALEPTNPNGTTRTLLTVTVQNSNNTLLEGVLVATLDPVTGASRYGLTDYSGTVYIFDIQPSNSFIVGARKEGYETTSVYASISNGEQKNVNIIMGQSRGANGYFPATARQCADTLSGVWLCGNLSTTGIGNSCTQDTDCISGRCSVGLTIRECSRFNYTLCDAQGINRGNTCIFKNMTRGIFTTIGDLILGNFLYVLLLVFLIVAGLIIKRSLSR